MRILDINDNVIETPDLKKGHLERDRILIAHHDAIPAVEEKWHHEITAVYPNGGKDIAKVIDVAGQEAREAYDEYETVMRYIEYTPEEIAERNKPTQEQRLASVESAVLGIMRILRGGK